MPKPRGTTRVNNPSMPVAQSICRRPFARAREGGRFFFSSSPRLFLVDSSDSKEFLRRFPLKLQILLLFPSLHKNSLLKVQEISSFSSLFLDQAYSRQCNRHPVLFKRARTETLFFFYPNNHPKALTHISTQDALR
jgi:hypothetical protein